MFKKIISRLRTGTQEQEFQVERSLEEKALFHWKILIVVFFVIALFVLATSFVVYQDIGRGEFSPVTKTSPAVSGQVTLERLEKLVSYFETKSVTFDQVRKNRAVSVDPSR